MGRLRLWSEADVNDAVSMLTAGQTRAEVCAYIGCTDSALRRALLRYAPLSWPPMSKRPTYGMGRAPR